MRKPPGSSGAAATSRDGRFQGNAEIAGACHSEDTVHIGQFVVRDAEQETRITISYDRVSEDLLSVDGTNNSVPL